MLNTPFSPWPSFTPQEADAVRDVLLSNKVNYWTGAECRSFEKEFAAWAGVQHAVALVNGTLALDVALKALGIGPGDEVVVTPRTFMASVPFIDCRVVEFAWQLPMHYKLRRQNNSSTTKWALRQVLFRYVPRALMERPKMDFGVPIDTWLRGPLRPWVEYLLSESRLKREGYFNPASIRQKWAEHLSGQRNWKHQLWNVLMFQAWLAESKA